MKISLGVVEEVVEHGRLGGHFVDVVEQRLAETGVAAADAATAAAAAAGGGRRRREEAGGGVVVEDHPLEAAQVVVARQRAALVVDGRDAALDALALRVQQEGPEAARHVVVRLEDHVPNQ